MAEKKLEFKQGGKYQHRTGGIYELEEIQGGAGTPLQLYHFVLVGGEKPILTRLQYQIALSPALAEKYMKEPEERP